MGSYGHGPGSAGVIIGISLSNNDLGTSNTVLGLNAGANIAAGGTYNIIIGEESANDITTGDNNIFIGYQAGDKTTDVDGAVVIGHGAAGADMTADADGTVVIGTAAGAAITSGIGNTAVGFNALDTEDDGDQNTAIGYKTLTAQTGTSGEVGNTAVGYSAGQFITTAAGTTFVGNECGKGIGATKLTGNNNTALGSDAGLLLQGAAHSNTFIGAEAGAVATTAVENVCIGFNADIEDATATNQIVIGNNVTGVADNAVHIGNDTRHIRCDFGSDQTWDAPSDERIKNITGDSPLGLDFINSIPVKTFKWKPPSEYPQEFSSYNSEKTEPADILEHHGLIAQSVKAALDAAGVVDFSGWGVDSDGMQTVGESAFVYPLMKAVQELSAKVKELESKLDK